MWAKLSDLVSAGYFSKGAMSCSAAKHKDSGFSGHLSLGSPSLPTSSTASPAMNKVFSATAVDLHGEVGLCVSSVSPSSVGVMHGQQWKARIQSETSGTEGHLEPAGEGDSYRNCCLAVLTFRSQSPLQRKVTASPLRVYHCSGSLKRHILQWIHFFGNSQK